MEKREGFRSPDRSTGTWNPAALAALAGLVLGLIGIFAAGQVHPPAAASREDGALGVLSVLLVLFALPAGWIVAASLLTAAASGGLMLRMEDLPARLRAYDSFLLRADLSNVQPFIPDLFALATATLEAPCGQLETPPEFVGAILPRRRTAIGWRIVARQRGWLTLRSIGVRFEFPGSVLSRRHEFDLGSRIRILPLVYRLNRSVMAELSGRLPAAAGRTQSSPAAWEEFVGVRAYRPGDNPRFVHLPLSLRLPDFPFDLVVKEFEDPTQEDVWVALEPGVAGANQKDYAFRYERAISFAASLCRVLLKNGLRIRFLTTSGEHRSIILDAGERRTDIHRIETELSTLVPSGDHARFRALLAKGAREARERTVLVVSVSGEPHPGVVLTPEKQGRLIEEVLLS